MGFGFVKIINFNIWNFKDQGREFAMVQWC